MCRAETDAQDREETFRSSSLAWLAAGISLVSGSLRKPPDSGPEEQPPGKVSSSSGETEPGKHYTRAGAMIRDLRTPSSGYPCQGRPQLFYCKGQGVVVTAQECKPSEYLESIEEEREEYGAGPRQLGGSHAARAQKPGR